MLHSRLEITFEHGQQLTHLLEEGSCGGGVVACSTPAIVLIDM